MILNLSNGSFCYTLPLIRALNTQKMCAVKIMTEWMGEKIIHYKTGQK